ncbi:MAG: hypothetical protein IPG63_05105 [Xanthomonadales bacterium]|nr:hypothetical protein [Xanthomonadales bacterium]
MDRRGWTLTLCALAVGVGLFWGTRAGDTDAPPAAAFDVSGAKVEAAASTPAAPDAIAADPNTKLDLLAALADASQAPPPPPPTFTEPLPRWDAKLVDVLPALKARADAGDHVAACHIGLALSACAWSISLQPSPAEIRQTRSEDDATIERMARLATDTFRPGREKTCADLPASELELRFQYAQQAADAGVGAAMLAYAEGVPLLSIDAILRHPEWLEAHRQRAPRYIAELIRRGDRFAAFLLSMGSDGMQMSLLGKALQMDEVTAATFWYLRQEFMGQPMSPWHGPTPSIERIARERAHALYERYFEPRPFRSGEFKDRFDMMNVERCGLTP